MSESACLFNLELFKERARQEKAPQPLTDEDIKNTLNKLAFDSYKHTVRL